ncbi:acyltransferase family protein [Sphingomonas sp. 8AM]|uniref:acyltransferase family protein n=1 Tax=Sphingomonas sp. 8AM TaxID=2653170 RepID=UPI00135ACE52|nr:acyltransferase [Sphingomonas sp. 8AM]
MSSTAIPGAHSRALLTNLQYVRALAAYLVVLYHARLLTPLGQALPLDFGRAGVDIFFVISGFIIQHVAARDDAGRPGAFLVKRLIRIAPLYWILTLMIGLAGPFAPALAGKAGVPDAGMIARSLLFIPYVDGAGDIHPVLFTGWTLNYEMFFYALFAVGLLIMDGLRRLVALSVALVLLVTIGATSDPDGAVGITYTSPLLLEFGAGLWLNMAWQRIRHVTSATRLAAGAAMAGGFTALVLGTIFWPTVPDVLKWGIPAVVIVAAALLCERADGGGRYKLALLLGEASYAIYLIHPFVIKAASLAAARLFRDAAIPLQAALLFGTLVAVGVVGVALHLLVERPLLSLLRRWLLPRSSSRRAHGSSPVRN